jgi:hypothetical protein
MLNAKEDLHRSELPIVESQPAVSSDPHPPQPTTRAEIPDLIAELAELHQQGVLSQEEFETKKRELLARL